MVIVGDSHRTSFFKHTLLYSSKETIFLVINLSRG